MEFTFASRGKSFSVSSTLFLTKSLISPLTASSLNCIIFSLDIVGIDYNRITQKTYGGKKSFSVDLKLGDVSFSGELYGDYGLTYEELNDIIYKTLADNNLTVDRIVLVGKIASQVGTDAAKYWGDQVIEGLLSYLPLPTAEGLGSVGDAYTLAVHGDPEPGPKSSIFNASKASASEAISRAAKLGGSSETVNGDETFSQDPGTVFSPLENDPVIIITFK